MNAIIYNEAAAVIDAAGETGARKINRVLDVATDESIANIMAAPTAILAKAMLDSDLSTTARLLAAYAIIAQDS